MNAICHEVATQFTTAIIAEHFRGRQDDGVDLCHTCHSICPQHEFLYYEDLEEVHCLECYTPEEFRVRFELDPDEFTEQQNNYQNKLKEDEYVPPFSGDEDGHGAYCLVCYESIYNSDLYHGYVDADCSYWTGERQIRYTCEDCCENDDRQNFEFDD